MPAMDEEGNDGRATREAEYARSMRALNAQFATWVARQKERAPCTSWEEGVADYLRHAKKLAAHRRHAAAEEVDVEHGKSKKRNRVEEKGREEEEGDEKTSFTAKCKVFFREEGEWATRGVGYLSLRTSTSDPNASRLVFRTEAGKVLLNARIYRGLKAKVQDKSVVMVLYVADEGEGESGKQPQSKQTLVRFGKVELAKELQEAIETHTPQ